MKCVAFKCDWDSAISIGVQYTWILGVEVVVSIRAALVVLVGVCQ